MEPLHHRWSCGAKAAERGWSEEEGQHHGSEGLQHASQRRAEERLILSCITEVHLF